MKKSRVIIGLVLICVLILSAGLGTYAWFTSKSTSSGNRFETGILKIEGPGTIEAEWQSQGGIYPGWKSDVISKTIKNDGTLDFKYRMYVDPVDSILFNGATPLQINVNNKGYVDINKLGYVYLGQISKGQSDTVTFQFRLPEEANNAYQNIGATFTFNFVATQVENNSGVVVTNAGRIYGDLWGSISEKYTDVEVKFSKDFQYTDSQWKVSYWTKDVSGNLTEIKGSDGTTVRKDYTWSDAWVDISESQAPNPTKHISYTDTFKAGKVYGTAINSTNGGSKYATDAWWEALYDARDSHMGVFVKLEITDEAGNTSTTYCPIAK